MAKQTIDKAADALLKDEFKKILTDIEEAIAADPSYSTSQDFITKKRRLTQIMVKIEGCGCNGRAEMLRKLQIALANGQKNTFRTFGPLIIRSFAVDIKKAFKIL